MKPLIDRIAMEQALVDGKRVQERAGESSWQDVEQEHVFYWDCCSYRIKPELVEFYVSMINGTPSTVNVSRGYVEAIIGGDPEWEIVKVRVIE